MEKNNGENNFLHFPIPKMEKNNGEKVKTGNFLHYWNGEKEWGKNINNGEKLLMKMGKILSWIHLHHFLHEYNNHKQEPITHNPAYLDIIFTVFN